METAGEERAAAEGGQDESGETETAEAAEEELLDIADEDADGEPEEK